jgi:hypothetical protein
MTISIAPSIETQSTFFEREIKLFPIRKIFEWFLNNYRQKLNAFLDEAYTNIQGTLVVLKEYTKEDAQRDLPFVKKAIKLLVTYKSLLEKAEYLGSKDIEIKVNLVISALYDAELQLKKKAFAGQSRTSAQPELLEAMASASKEALRSALSN